MKFFNKFSLIIFFAFFLSGCIIALDGKDDDNYFKVGLIAPLSVDVDYGPRIRDMVNYSFNEININGGINGKQVKLIVYDGLCTKGGGASAAKELIEKHNVKIIIGGVCSGETLGAAPIAEANEVILISVISQNAEISKLGDFVFRLTPSSEKTLSKLAEEAYKLGYRKIASISQLTPYTSSERRSFIQKFEELGGEVVFSDYFLPGELDISHPFIRLKESDVDSVLILAQTTGGYSRMRDEMQKVGLSSNDFQIFTNFILDLDGSKSDYYTFYNSSIYEDYYLIEGSEGYNKLIDIVDNNFGEEFYIGAPLWSLATSYDVTYIIKDIMSNCDFEDTLCIRDNLYLIKDHKGIFNLKAIDENGDGVTDFTTFVVGENRRGKALE